MTPTDELATPKKGLINKLLDFVERAGNKLPDPAILFFTLMIIIWLLSAVFSTFTFSEINPTTGEAIAINNLLTGSGNGDFLATLITVLVNFAPLCIVL